MVSYAGALLVFFQFAALSYGELAYYHIPSGPSLDDDFEPVDVGFDSAVGFISSIGDFNADKFSDLVFIGNNGTFAEIYVWDTSKYTYEPMAASRVMLPGILEGNALDFNYDGKMDVLLQHAKEDGSVGLRIYFGSTEGFYPNYLDLPPAKSRVSIIDANNDLLPDLFGETASTGERVIWLNGGLVEGEEPGTSLPTVSLELGKLQNPDGDLMFPSPHIFADINGDCLADMIIVSGNPQLGTAVMEVWINGGTAFVGNYNLAQKVPLPKGAGFLSVSDYDGDGANDIVFPVCTPLATCADDNSVRVLYNTMRPCCGTISTSRRGTDDCRSCSKLCTIDEEKPKNFGFTFGEDASKPSEFQVIVPAKFVAIGGTSPVQLKFTTVDGPPKLHSGDYNRDGFRDLVGVLYGAGQESMAVLFESVACSATFECAESAMSRRTFFVQQSGMENAQKIRKVTYASFLDLDEVGDLDLVVGTNPALFPVAEGAAPEPQRVHFFFNHFVRDLFFIKAIGLNGVCPRWCKSGAKFPDPQPLGGMQYGATYMYSVVDNDSKKHIVVGSQLAQSSYLSLSTPYVVFGLGYVSNYVDELYMGVPLSQKEGWIGTWLGLIPNSQVATTPYERRVPSAWIMWMYVEPGAKSLWLFLGACFCCAVNVAIMFYLHVKEKRADKTVQKQTAHLFTFSAL